MIPLIPIPADTFLALVILGSLALGTLIDWIRYGDDPAP